MIVDLHSHTSAYSECGRDSLTAMVRAAMDRGLDALCVTEHDVVYPEERADAEVGGGPEGMTLFRGIEVNCHGPGGIVAHIVVLGCEELQGPYHDPGELERLVRRSGAAMVLAHPFRYGDDAHRIVECLTIDAIEVDSVNVDEVAAAKAAEFAESLGLPQVAGSDAHRVADVGAYATRFDRPVGTASELAKELRAGRVHPVRWSSLKGEWE